MDATKLLTARKVGDLILVRQSSPVIFEQREVCRADREFLRMLET